MICNFSRRSGIDALAGKIRNGVKIELDDIRVISPVIIRKSDKFAPPLVEKKTLKQSIFKIIKFPWHFLKAKMETLIEFKLLALHQEIQMLNKQIRMRTQQPSKTLLTQQILVTQTHNKILTQTPMPIRMPFQCGLR